MADELKPLYLLTGLDRPKIEARAAAGSATRFDADGARVASQRSDTSGADARRSRRTRSGSSARNAPRRSSRRSSAGKAEDAKAVSTYAGPDSPPPESRSRSSRAKLRK